MIFQQPVKTVLFTALLVASSNVFAGWTKLIEHLGQTEYRDFSTVRIDGSNRQIWKLQDFSKAICLGTVCYQSIKSLLEFDCDHDESRTKYVLFYTGRLGEGEPVKTLKGHEIGDDSELLPVVPGTQGYYELQGICHKG